MSRKYIFKYNITILGSRLDFLIFWILLLIFKTKFIIFYLRNLILILLYKIIIFWFIL